MAESRRALTKENRRRGDGVKLASDCYRTIKGQEFQAWMSFPSKDRVDNYRKSGVRCIVRGDELFVHIMDVDQARDFDRKFPA
jgi:hypothetical protein